MSNISLFLSVLGIGNIFHFFLQICNFLLRVSRKTAFGRTPQHVRFGENLKHVCRFFTNDREKAAGGASVDAS
ncbi:MAG: hypothetical protein IIY01_00510, partial [Clostridia bacterium]|nr:hypothetical protein [Clostridia bacterium]